MQNKEVIRESELTNDKKLYQRIFELGCQWKTSKSTEKATLFHLLTMNTTKQEQNLSEWCLDKNTVGQQGRFHT